MLRNKHIRFILLCTLMSTAALLHAQSTVNIVGGGTDGGRISGGVFIGLNAQINTSVNETASLLDATPGNPEGSWKDVTGIQQVGNTLTKTAIDGWGNAGATSNSILDSTENGWMQFKVDNLQNTLAFGFSNSNADADFTSIKYAVMLNAEQLSVYNQGVLIGNFGIVGLNDSIRIERVGDILFYTKNNIVFFNQQVNVVQALIVDASIYTQGGALIITSSFSHPCGVFPVIIASPASQAVCSGNASSIALASNIPGTAFSWSVVQSGVSGASAGTGNNISQTLTTLSANSGSAVYTITPIANGCPGMPVNVIVTVNPIPLANAGSDQTISSNSTSVSLNGSVNIATGGIWSTPGNGTFSPNANTLNGTYTPSVADITAGTVALTLTTTGNGNCNPISDEMVVIFAPISTFGLLASGTINSNDSVFVVGDIGAINGVSSYIRASGNVFQNNNTQIQQALSYSNADKNYFTSLGGINISAQLKGQSLSAGNYLIQGNTTLDSVLNLSGDTSSFFIFNIQGALTVLKGSALTLNNLKYKNIIWNVSGNVTLQGNIDFSGIIISNGNIIYNTENFGKVSLSAPNGNITLQNNGLLIIPLSLYSTSGLKNLFTPPLIQVTNPNPVSIPFCDSKIEPALTKNISLAIDRFNNAWIPSAQSPTSVNCSGFNLYFEDAMLGTGVGFDDLSFGIIRQQTACAVFNYLATVINLNGVHPDILIAASETNGIGPLAVGSPFYNSILPSGFDGGDLYKHITTGTDPSSFPYDGRLKINFGNRIINGNVITIFSGYPASSGGQLDLFSIMLHEAMHALGFASLMGFPNGASLMNGPYSIFDKYIKMGNNFLVSSSATFQGNAPSDLISNQLFFSKTNSCAPQPIYSPFAFQTGSSMSHYDDLRSTYRFVMRPSTSGGDDRILTNPEIRTLCDLGYSVFGTTCSNCPPLGINDYGSTSCGGSQVCINALSNDVDPENNQIYFDLTFGNNGILILNGGGSVSINGNQICYTPSTTFTGTAHLQYRPKDALLSGNATDIYITVSCSYCPADPCNLVCNGNMEDGISLSAFDTYSNFNDFISTYPIPTNVTNWWATTGTPDLFIRGSQRPGPYTPNQGIPLNFFDNVNYFPNGVDTHNGFPNNRYVGAYREASGSPFYEGFFAKLVQPLIQTKTYNLDLWVFAANQANASSISGLVNILLSNTVPSSSGNNIIAGSGIQSIISNYSFPNSQWHHIIVSNIAIAPANTNLQYLIIEPVKPSAGNWTQYLFFDDVRLVENTPVITITNIVNNPTPSYNQNITYSIQVCNTGISTANNVVIQDILPSGLTVVSGYTSYPNIAIGNLTASQCITVNVVATVTNSIPVNTIITNCAAVIGGSNCGNYANASNCIDIKVPATDISVVKTVSNLTPCSGSVFSYSLVITNLGNVNATNLHVLDLLPSGINYVSYSLSCSGTYNNSTGDLNIPLLVANSSCTLNVIVNTSTAASGIFNNCATLLSLDQIEIGLGNNSSCASVNITSLIVSLTALPSTIVQGNSCTLSVTQIPGVSYSWQPGGLTGNSITVTPNASITYTVTASGTNGCQSSNTVTVTVVPVTCNLTYQYVIPLTGAISSLVFGSGSNIIIVNKNINVLGTLFIDNINLAFQNCNFVMQSPNSKIIIQTPTSGPRTLTLTEHTHLYSCGNMWDGIYVQPHTNLNIAGDAFIEDAIHAIVSVNGGTYTINGAIFNRNLTGVEVQPFNGTHLGTIANTVFTSRNIIPAYANPSSNPNVATLKTNLNGSTFTTANLKAPHADIKGLYGVNASSVFALNVGVTTANYNLFDAIMCGINLTRTNATIYNNSFQYLLSSYPTICPSTNCPTPSSPPENGYGIKATGTSSVSYTVNIGGAGNSQANTFNSIYRSIEINNYKNTTILNNTIDNINTFSGLGLGYGNKGISLTPASNNTIDLENNSITNCADGIWINRGTATSISTLSMKVDHNRPITANSTGYCNNGIYITDLLSGTTVIPTTSEIIDNGISECVNGINILHVKKIININANFCNVRYYNFGSSAVSTGPRNGIKINGCQQLKIDNNNIQYNTTAATVFPAGNINAYGIYLQLSTNMLVKCNLIENAARSMVFEGNCLSSPYFASYGIMQNTMRRAQDGFVLLTNGVIGQQGAYNPPFFNFASNNYWDMSSTPNFSRSETYTQNSFTANTASKLFMNNITSGANATMPIPILNKTFNAPGIDNYLSTGANPGLNISSAASSACGSIPHHAPSSGADSIAAAYGNELKALLADSVNLPLFIVETNWMRKKFIYNELNNVNQLNAFNGLDNFKNNASAGNIGKLELVEDRLEHQNFTAANAILNTITPTTGNIPEQNLLTVNNLILKQLTNTNYAYTSADSTVLYSIAEQCPLSGGDAVYQSRVLLMNMENNVIDFIDNCDGSTGRMMNKLSATPETGQLFKIYPNPNNGNMLLDYSLNSTDRAEILIYDIAGKLIEKYELNTSANQMTIRSERLNNGIYFYQIRVNDKMMQSNKLIIIK